MLHTSFMREWVDAGHGPVPPHMHGHMHVAQPSSHPPPHIPSHGPSTDNPYLTDPALTQHLTQPFMFEQTLQHQHQHQQHQHQHHHHQQQQQPWQPPVYQPAYTQSYPTQYQHPPTHPSQHQHQHQQQHHQQVYEYHSQQVAYGYQEFQQLPPDHSQQQPQQQAHIQHQHQHQHQSYSEHQQQHQHQHQQQQQHHQPQAHYTYPYPHRTSHAHSQHIYDEIDQENTGDWSNRPPIHGIYASPNKRLVQPQPPLQPNVNAPGWMWPSLSQEQQDVPATPDAHHLSVGCAYDVLITPPDATKTSTTATTTTTTDDNVERWPAPPIPLRLFSNDTTWSDPAPPSTSTSATECDAADPLIASIVSLSLSPADHGDAAVAGIDVPAQNTSHILEQSQPAHDGRETRQAAYSQHLLNSYVQQSHVPQEITRVQTQVSSQPASASVSTAPVQAHAQVRAQHQQQPETPTPAPAPAPHPHQFAIPAPRPARVQSQAPSSPMQIRILSHMMPTPIPTHTMTPDRKVHVSHLGNLSMLSPSARTFHPQHASVPSSPHLRVTSRAPSTPTTKHSPHHVMTHHQHLVKQRQQRYVREMEAMANDTTHRVPSQQQPPQQRRHHDDDHDTHSHSQREQPSTAFKAFYHTFWQHARISPSDAHAYAQSQLTLYTEHDPMYVRICMEIADLYKRHNKIDMAREWYECVHRLDPTMVQGWLEHAKMEEECGELTRCGELLLQGLKYNPEHESLLIKTIKHMERQDDLETARAVLATIKDVPVERVWRTVMEGGMMEARAGRLVTARRVFKYLTTHVSWYGPVYAEWASIESSLHHYARAAHIIETGIQHVSRYGPLWFAAIKLYERVDVEKAREVVQRALKQISNELVWKLYFELAMVEDRASRFDASRHALYMSIHHCPPNLRWKVWLAGARMELRTCDVTRITIARSLLNRAHAEVPKKMRAMVLLECSRLEEFVGNLDAARSILARARDECSGEWKVFLESVLIEMRAGHLDEAIQRAMAALTAHPGTGRLWAILIQLHQHDETAQLRVFRRAIQHVPKSGEVWCEGARLVLNPTSQHFNLEMAERFLSFAMRFTPQYGDSFIEFARVQMLLHGWDHPEAMKRVEQLCLNASPNYGAAWFLSLLHTATPLTPSLLDILNVAINTLMDELYQHASLYQRAMLKQKSEEVKSEENKSIKKKKSSAVENTSSEKRLEAKEKSQVESAESESEAEAEAEAQAEPQAQAQQPEPSSASAPVSAQAEAKPASALDTMTAPAATAETTVAEAIPETEPRQETVSTAEQLKDAEKPKDPFDFAELCNQLAAMMEGEQVVATPRALSTTSSPATSIATSTCTSVSTPSTVPLSPLSLSDSSVSCSPCLSPCLSPVNDHDNMSRATLFWKRTHLTSLHRLYPRISTLEPLTRHALLFGSDPIQP